MEHAPPVAEDGALPIAPPAAGGGLAAVLRVAADALAALRRGDVSAALAALEGLVGRVPVAAPATAPGAVPPMALRLLGGFDVAIGGVPVDRWPRRKAKLALAALYFHPRGLAPADFEDVVGDDVTATIARVAVLNLRRTLEPALDQGDDSAYVRFVDGRYVLAREHLAETDVARFEAAIAEAEADAAGGEAALERAMALYRGHLLDDAFFGLFFAEERERLRQQAMGALMRLAALAEADGRADAAEAWLRRATTLAPDVEEGHVALMRHYHGRGRLMMVRKAYWDARRALKVHVGLATAPALDAAFAACGGQP